MIVSKEVSKRVKNKPLGELITYDEFKDLDNFSAVSSTLKRLQKTGIIERLSKGMYYRPKKTQYGTLPPTESEVLKALLKTKSKGHVSGITAFNALGLTTQVPNVVVIAGDNSPRFRTIGQLKIKFTKGDGATNLKDTKILQILDAMQSIKKISGTNVTDAFAALKQKIETLTEDEIKRMATLAQKRRPLTRALLGAMIENKYPEESRKLAKTLNSLTIYKLGISDELLPNKNKWKIK